MVNTDRYSLNNSQTLMATLIAIPILGLLLIFQSAILSRIPLLHGTADLLLLAIVAWGIQKRVQTAWQWALIGAILVTLASALPLGVALVNYLAIAAVTVGIRQRVWKVPILTMFLATFLATVISHFISLVALRLSGNPLPWLESLNLITLPSLLLNLILAIPAYAIFSDLAKWVYPEELEV